MADVIRSVKANVLIVSYNNESWVAADQIMKWLRDVGYEDVRLIAFDSKRYVGAQIGIYHPSGERVGKVSHLRNTEYVFVAGPTGHVDEAVVAARVHPASTAYDTLF
jgi:adenine-specific DNA-methyltransferase